METSSEKNKVMFDDNDKEKIYLNGVQLKEVNIKYLGANPSKDGRSTADIFIKIMAVAAALARLSKLWHSSTIRFTPKYKLLSPSIKSCCVEVRHEPCLQIQRQESRHS